MSTRQVMDLDGSRRGSAPKAGSVWENRMKVDQVKGGIKVFNATHDYADQDNSTKITCKSSSTGSSTGGSTMNNTGVQVDKKVNNMRAKQSPVGVNGKRKTWKSESSEGSPVQNSRKRSELRKNLEEECKELSVSCDGNGIKKSPVQIKKTKSVSGQKGTGDPTNDGNEITLVQLRKEKSDSAEALNDSKSEVSSELSKVKSEPSKILDQSFDGTLKNSLSLQLVEAKSVVARQVTDEYTQNSDHNKDLEGPAGETEKSRVGIERSRSDEDLKEFGVCEEKVMTSNVGQIEVIRTPPNVNYVDCEEEEEEKEEEDEEEEEVDQEINFEVEKKTVDIKDITISVKEEKPKKLVIQEKKLLHSNETQLPVSPIVKKQIPPAVNHVRIHPNPTKTNPIPVSDHFHGSPSSQSKLQSFVDLIMWRDVSKSAFVFGIGAFVIISSSYTKDLNISFISVLSYLGLTYLAANFLSRSFISRVAIDVDNTKQDCVVGEEEAVWLIKLVLPYLNEFLLKLRGLFSGDPATTIKLAVLLFILARCGGSITIWKMAKLGFFGVFTVPKVASSYSSQLTAYGIFWIQRFEDAWRSCSHKKAVGLGIFTLVWNLSSVVARIWAVFILFVAFKYYQQYSWIKEEGLLEEDTTENSNSQYVGGRQQGQARRTTITEIKKQKKVC